MKTDTGQKIVFLSTRFRQFNCGYESPNTQPAHLRLKQSFSGCHLQSVAFTWQNVQKEFQLWVNQFVSLTSFLRSTSSKKCVKPTFHFGWERVRLKCFGFQFAPLPYLLLASSPQSSSSASFPSFGLSYSSPLPPISFSALLSHFSIFLSAVSSLFNDQLLTWKSQV